MFKMDVSDVSSKFKAVVDATKNYRPYFKVVVGEGDGSPEWTLKGSINKSFKTQTDPAGNSWAPLNAKYKKQKDKKKAGLPILQYSSKLWESLVFTNKYSVNTQTNNMLTFGTNIPYGNVHQFGYPDKRIPRRSYLGWRLGQKQYMQKLLLKYVQIAWTKKRVTAADLEGAG